MEYSQREEQNFLSYVLDNIALEKKLYDRRRNLINSYDKLRAYFQSTPTKYIIGKYLVAGALDVNLLYSCSQISKLIHVSRTAVCKIVNDAVDAGWAEEEYIDKIRYVRATEIHVAAYKDYAWAVLEARNEFVTDYCAAQKLLGNV